jgi:hypothetical protein
VNLQAEPPPAASPAEDWQRELDGLDLYTLLNELRGLVESDLELWDLHRQAVRAVFSDLPAVYVALVVLSFCERWLELAEPGEPTRLFVEALACLLRPLAEDEPEPGLDGRQLVHEAAEFARPQLYPGLYPSLPTLPPHAAPHRRARARESRPRQARRVRSGTSRDGPSPGSEADPDPDLEPGLAGLDGVPPEAAA